MQEEHVLRRSIRSRKPPARFSGWYGLRMYNASRDKFISAHQKKQQHTSQGVEQSVSVLDVSQHGVSTENSRCLPVEMSSSQLCTHIVFKQRKCQIFSYHKSSGFSQWIQQGHDGSIYISKEFLESLEPEVPVTVAVPSLLKPNSLLEGGYRQSEGSSVVTDNVDQYSDDELDYVAEEMSEEDMEQSQQDSEDECEDDNEEHGSR